MLKHTGQSATDAGQKRSRNEDYHLIDESIGLYIVCDGVGGHAAGDFASQTTAEEIRRYLLTQKTVIDQVRASATSNFDARTKINPILRDAVQSASTKVFQASVKDPAKKGMGTTVVLALFTGSTVTLAHVGDSRIYLVRNGRQHQLTEDHSLVAEQLRKGLLTPETAAKSIYAHIITRAVGFHEAVEVDTLQMEIEPEDIFLLCSDGIADYFHADEFSKLATVKKENRNLAHDLVAFALKQGGKDNATAITVEIQGQLKADSLSTEKKLEVLKQIPLFRYLSYQELIKVLNAASMKTFEAGVKVIEEGKMGAEFFVILSGTVQVSKAGKQLASLKPTDFFGEMQLLDKVPRSATVTVEQTVKLLSFSQTEFFGLLKVEKDLAVKIFWEFCQVLNTRLRTVNELFVGAAARISAEEVDELPFVPAPPADDPTLEIQT